MLREAVASGVNHIDTSDFYGPHVTNQLIREALHPYPEQLTLVTKIGAWRDDSGAWILERSPAFLRRSVEENLERLRALAAASAVLNCDAETAARYGELKAVLRAKGTPIPENDLWIAAGAKQHDLAGARRAAHFAVVPGVVRVTWPHPPPPPP